MRFNATETIGRKFSKLKVLEILPALKPGKYRAKCECDCGSECVVLVNNLKSGTSKSCGCRRSEIPNPAIVLHGMTGTKEYNAWLGIRARCYRKTHRQYRIYGARGIRVCREWKSDFIAFFNYIGPAPGTRYSIGRIRNSDGYKPGNVRWETPSQQTRNRRTTVMSPSRVIKIRGMANRGVSARQIATNLGFNISTVNGVIRYENWKEI